MYSLTHDWLIDAFKQIHSQGVRIRLLLDKQMAGSPKSDHEKYRKMGIRVCLDTEPGFMHNKFAIRDEEIVLTGSYNWTARAQEKNRGNFLVIKYPHVVEAYQKEFDLLWEINKAGILPNGA